MTATLPRRGLYVITAADVSDMQTPAAAVAAAIRGGAVMVQYRAKGNATTACALALAGMCRAHSIPLIINDDPQLARAVGADGVHLGKEDTTIAQARDYLGTQAIIGISCYDELARAHTAVREGANYVAFGRFFPSMTKPNATPAPLSLLQQARESVQVPIVAIGGITPENGAALIEAGADMLAVIEGVFAQPDIHAAARRYAQLF